MIHDSKRNSEAIQRIVNSPTQRSHRPPQAVNYSPIPVWDGAVVMRALLDLRDYQVCGDWPGSARQRGDRQRFRGSFRIAHRQNRVDYGGFHNRHSNNLGGSCCAACHRICQIFTVQGQDQLSRFGHTHLEQHLIGADLRQIEGAGAGTGNAGSTVGTILREAHIRTGCYGCSIVGRH